MPGACSGWPLLAVAVAVAAIGGLCLDQIWVLRPGDGGRRGRAAHGRRDLWCAPLLLLDGDAGPAPSWWWGKGLAGACWGRQGGALSYAGLLSVVTLRRQVGAGYGLGQELAAGMVLSRAKAFTDAFVCGDGGGALVASSPCWGHHCEAPYSYCTEFFRVKTLSIYGRATAVPLASCPRWRRRIWSPSLARLWSWLMGGVARAQRQRRCAWSVLAGRCRGPLGAGGLELAHIVQW